MQKINPIHLAETAKRVLVAPLDWGLGHTTRCIPIIKELEKQGCAIWLAGNEVQEVLLKKEFPHLLFLPLRGYNVSYAKTSIGLVFKLFAQLPSIAKIIRYENEWLNKKVKELELDAVIADNRYGLFHSTIPCIFITHQLQIKTAWGKWSERMIQKWNYHFIHQYRVCWIPDYAGHENLAGELSHPQLLPDIPVKYLGPVSRFEKTKKEITNDLLIILSGPEPQRTILEKIILNQLKTINRKTVLVRGLPVEKKILENEGLIEFHNHLASEELNELIEKSSWIISRCGYSTVMDLMKLQKKTILIPTPGQTEQEYLARHLGKNKMAFTMMQKNFDLQTALNMADKFPYQFPTESGNVLKARVAEFLMSLHVNEPE